MAHFIVDGRTKKKQSTIIIIIIIFFRPHILGSKVPCRESVNSACHFRAAGN